MSLGKFLLLIAGTVVSFKKQIKYSLMKNIDIRILLLYVLFFFVAACSSTKKNKQAVAVYKNAVIAKAADEEPQVKMIEVDSIELKRFYEHLDSSRMESLQFELVENTITILKNTNSVLPIKNLEKQHIAYVKLGDTPNTTFVTTLKKYADVTEVSDINLVRLQEKLKGFSTVIIGYHKSDGLWKDQKFSEEELNKIAFLAQNNQVILDVFASPFVLSSIKVIGTIEGLIVSYKNNATAQVVSAELIFGAISAKGKLPVSISPEFKVNFGLSTEKLDVLGFSTPENVGVSSSILSKIDVIAQKAINGKMTPGMQILVARKGKVIYQKSFGYHTFDKEIKVSNSDIYDLASLTKIIGTLPNVMQQYDQGKLNMQTTLDSMLPIFRNSNKKDIYFKELLSHYARLQPWYPFYKNTIDRKGKPLDKYYRKVSDANFSIKIADSLYLRTDYQDTILRIIVDSKLLPKKEYKYSDFTFMILKEYLEHVTGKKLDVLSTENFFQPLGLNNTMYNPINKISKNNIVPTEVDTYFRYQTIQGYVHDMGAAMQGGVAGHAGLFSNSMDVAKMMQLYLQKGSYGGKRYFSEKTFNDFNQCYYCAEGNRRGVGFDKPQLGSSGPTCGCASMTSFGHTGFTGTMAWADPDKEIVYVFLSNRTYPNESINKLSKENIREDIQSVIYEAIDDSINVK
jgi:CubicO group peptidase (beta-lactamase class C family)